MKMYKPKTENSDKKEMFLKINEDEDGEINIEVCDKDGGDCVLLLWFTIDRELKRMCWAKEGLEEYNYDTKSMEFNEEGQIVID